MTRSHPLSFHWSQKVIGSVSTKMMCSHPHILERATKNHIATLGIVSLIGENQLRN